MTARHIHFPSDEDGYRACSVCAGSVRGERWFQFNDLRLSGKGYGWRRDFPDDDPDDYERQEIEEGFSALSGPIVHARCAPMWLEALVIEAEAKVAR